MNPALFVAAVAGAGWGIIGAVCAMPWFHEAAWVPAWFGPAIGLLLARVQARLAPVRWPALLAFGAATLTVFAAWVGAAAQLTLEAAPLAHNAFTGESLPVAAGGVAGVLTRVAASALRTGVGVWTSGLAVVLWPLAVLTHGLLARLTRGESSAAASRP